MMNETQVIANAFSACNLEKVIPNREYKSSVFSLLYDDSRKLLDLYNALNQSSYTEPDELEIVTLSNALYIGMKNDKAFLLDYWLNLYEHQSTPNPNMPLRHLFYVVREYARLVDMSGLYRSSPMKLPTPRFVVFYNGKQKQPERRLLKLSDLFIQAEEDPMLELKVEFFNINAGYNEELKEACQSLREYCLFIERIHQYLEQEQSLKISVERAVEECIQEGILKEFLVANRGEVVAMSILEFTFEDWVKVMQEEQREIIEGREELRQGREEVRQGKEEVRQGKEELRQGREELRYGKEELKQDREELRLERQKIEQEREKLKREQDIFEEIKKSSNDFFLKAHEDGLKALVTSLQVLLPDAEAVYRAVIANEEYADSSKEKIIKYYKKR